jgi:hypothetical protein
VEKELKTARIKYSRVQVHIYANLMYIPTAAAFIQPNKNVL